MESKIQREIGDWDEAQEIRRTSLRGKDLPRPASCRRIQQGSAQGGKGVRPVIESGGTPGEWPVLPVRGVTEKQREDLLGHQLEATPYPQLLEVVKYIRYS
jgi:hypothetical protein